MPTAVIPDLIFCAAKNRRYAEIALQAGFRYGAQLPNRVYYAPYFVDQDHNNPQLDRAAYVAAVKQHRPHMATVLDWYRLEQLQDVLGWAEDVAPYVEVIVIVPKVPGEVWRLPRTISDKQVRLGYSVQTTYGGTDVPLYEFAGWPVHLLGGDPARQMALARRLDVHSADGNKWMLQASRNQVWVPRPVRQAKNRRWPQLQELGLGHIRQDSPYAAFKLSSQFIRAAWQTGRVTLQLPLV